MKLIRGSLPLVLLAVLTACGAQTPAASPGTSLTWAIETEPITFNPHQWSQNKARLLVFNQFDALVARDANGEFIPWLAKSWRVSPDGKTYTFELRDDVTFHDGERFDAAAVKANLDKLREPGYNPTVASIQLRWLDRVEVVSPTTVKITLKRPDGLFLDFLASPYAAQVSPRSLRTAKDLKAGGPDVVGTGPFILDRYVRGQEVRYRRNPAYRWAPASAAHQGPAHLAEITYRFLPEGAVRVGALTSGQVQVIEGVPATDIASIKSNPELTLKTALNSGSAFSYYFNTSRPPFDDERVRQAFREAVGVSLTIPPGECVALVGESGSGKSVTARSLLGLAGPGAVVRAARFEIGGRDARAFTARDWRQLRGRFAGLVLQDALVSLDPLRTVGAEIAEVLATHRVVPRAERAARIRRLLGEVGVPEPGLRMRQYPHQLSGGLRQRALIASAIAGEPDLIIADEPTTALDVTVQAQILRLLAARKAAGTALLVISHDLAAVASIADRILVMRDGTIVEEGTAARVLSAPGHPYTRALLAAVPSGVSRGTRLTAPGHPLPPRSPDRSAPVLTASGLSFAYGSRTAVDGVSFTLHRGETLGIVGESGSGKTTLARLVLGLLTPRAGEVRLHGRPWSGVPERERRPRRRVIQLIAQNPLESFDPRHTVARLLADPLARLPRAERRARVLELADMVALPRDVLDRRPRELSGGERQRVAIARAR